jgi:hypothetical protein
MKRFLAAISLLSIATGGVAIGAGSARLYRNPTMRVRSFEPPAGWEPSPAGAYPRLLVAYTHAEGGRMTLTAQRVGSATTAARLAAEARPPLEKQGFTSIRLKQEGARTHLEAELAGGQRLARQLYVVEEGFAYVVTLIAPLAAATQATADFDAAIRSLSLGVDVEPTPAGTPRRPDAGE